MNETPASALDQAAIFQSLQTLIGNWQGTNEDGQWVGVSYEMTANGTALVENWTFYNQITALTIYHMDGRALMAMHYCPIGNQPRLDLKHQSADGTLAFECVSATHLKNFKDPHEHAFDLKMNKDDSLYRSETYVETDGRLERNATLFRRVT